MREGFAPVTGTREVLCGCYVSKAISTVIETVVSPGQAGCEGDRREVMTLVQNLEPIHLGHTYRVPVPTAMRKGGLPFRVFYCITLGQGPYEYHSSCLSLPHKGGLCSIVLFFY